MTLRLFYNDSYLTNFTATVVGIDGTKVYLDQTAFYPTSGGQPFDRGELGGAPIVDVIDEDARIAHVTSSPAAWAEGTSIQGRVNWTRRFDCMQQHTGQHLLSAVFADLFGHETVSVHFGDQSSTLDLAADGLSREAALRAERRANELVFANRPVTVAFEDARTAAGLRKPSDREGEIRIVSIDALDRSACGGTHVRSTGEIGPVSIRKVEKTKKQVRVEFLCGWRSVERARVDFDALAQMATAMTCGIDELGPLVASQAEHLRSADTERRKLGEELARLRMKEQWSTTAPGADGVRRIVERGTTMDEIRTLGQAASTLPHTMFAGSVATPPSVVFAASEDTGVNAGAVLKALLSEHGGRGGGSPRAAQGTVPDLTTLDTVISALLVS
jgi:alanyl-tRNA synthetase